MNFLHFDLCKQHLNCLRSNLYLLMKQEFNILVCLHYQSYIFIKIIFAFVKYHNLLKGEFCKDFSTWILCVCLFVDAEIVIKIT